MYDLYLLQQFSLCCVHSGDYFFNVILQLKNIVAAFGPLKAYHFEINNDLNEPCAFLEVNFHALCALF